MSAENRPEIGLGDLREMVGVREDFNGQLKAGVTLDKGNALRVLDSNQEYFSKMKGYAQKARALKGIAEWARNHDEVTAKDILEAAGAEKPKEDKKGFSFKRLLGHG